MSSLLLNYSWFNGSRILTFDGEQQITGSLFQGAKDKREDISYGTYEILDEETLKFTINVDKNDVSNVIHDYTFTISREETNLKLQDLTVNPPENETLQPVKKLIEGN